MVHDTANSTSYTLSFDPGSQAISTFQYKYLTDTENVLKNEKRLSGKKVRPKAFVKFINKSMTKIELEKAQRQIGKLEVLRRDALEVGQVGLEEMVSREIVLLVKERVAFSLGCTHRIEKKVIDVFIGRVTDKVVKFDDLENFPRSIPIIPKRKILAAKRSNAFAGYKILFVDYTEQRVQSTADKIREKDPIVFGYFHEHPHILYPICDWVDDYCDITLDKLLKDEAIIEEITQGRVQEITDKDITALIKKVRENNKAIKEANRSNWKGVLLSQMIKDRVRILFNDLVINIKSLWKNKNI